MQAHFSELEEAFFREGDALAEEERDCDEIELAPPRQSLWQRLFRRDVQRVPDSVSTRVIEVRLDDDYYAAYVLDEYSADAVDDEYEAFALDDHYDAYVLEAA